MKRCTRCGSTAAAFVPHTQECSAETMRIMREQLQQLEKEPATIGDVLMASIAAAKAGGSFLGSLGGLFGDDHLVIARAILHRRGLPDGSPTIEDLPEADPKPAAAAQQNGNGNEKGADRSAPEVG